MTTDWRTPDSPLDEVRYRLATFKNPSFDRTVVEALMAEIESLDAARKANVETCVAYAKRIEELRQQVAHLTEALELRGEQIFGREGD